MTMIVSHRPSVRHSVRLMVRAESTATQYWLEDAMKKYLSPFPQSDPGSHTNPVNNKPLSVNSFVQPAYASSSLVVSFCLENGPQQRTCNVPTPVGYETTCEGGAWSNRCVSK